MNKRNFSYFKSRNEDYTRFETDSSDTEIATTSNEEQKYEDFIFNKKNVLRKKYDLKINFENKINKELEYKNQDLNKIFKKIFITESRDVFKVKSYNINQ